jgi:hypothetical protein
LDQALHSLSQKDRITLLPVSLLSHLERQIAKVKILHQEDKADGYGREYGYPRTSQWWVSMTCS